MKIALALSGGGFRALVFHLGVLARLAREHRLEQVTYLSTVSGGTLCAGLVYALNDFSWPDSHKFEQQVLLEARKILTTTDLKSALIVRTLIHIFDITESRADDLAILLKQHWGIDRSLQDIPETPRWMINATCYETGKNWRFERFRMGDYLFGYTYDMDLPLCEAMAASAGFPGLIGALALETSQRRWFKYKADLDEASIFETTGGNKRKTLPVQPPYSPVHLWDGGVYDNHGLEGLHDFIHGWRKDIDFLLVSDASGKPRPQTYQPGVKALERIITGIMMDQIRSLRARSIMERIINHGDKGAFLQIGNTTSTILEQAGRSSEIADKCPGCMEKDEVDKAADMETDIAKLDDETFDRLYRHGYEVADCTLSTYNPDLFHFIGYGG